MSQDKNDARREALSEDARMRFEALYERQGQWDIERPQPEIVRLEKEGWIRGHVLDIGCGTADNALYLADKGYDVWGVDIVVGAIGRAREKARARGLPFARMLVGDALDLESLGMQFDTVIDSGFFHALDDGEREYFLPGLRAVVRSGGLYHMLGFSDRQPGDWGPRRLREDDLRKVFSVGWKVLRLEEVLFDTHLHPGGAKAWLGSFERT